MSKFSLLNGATVISVKLFQKNYLTSDDTWTIGHVSENLIGSKLGSSSINTGVRGATKVLCNLGCDLEPKFTENIVLIFLLVSLANSTLEMPP